MSVALFLAGPRTVTLPVRTFTDIEQTFDPLVTAVCSVLIVLAAAAVLVIERSLGLGRVFGTRGIDASLRPVGSTRRVATP